jgi:serine protease
MKKFFPMIVVLVVAISIIGVWRFIGGKNSSNVYALDNVNCIPNQLVIGYDSDADLNQYSVSIREKFNLTQLEKAYKGSFEVVQFPADKKMADLIELIKVEPGVLYVEPNQICEATYVPNDPYYNTYQWNFFTKGKLFRGTASGNIQTASNYGIQAESAWDSFKPTNTATGAKYPGEGVKVAILDTGIAYANYITLGGISTSTSTFKKAPDLEGTIFDTVNAKNFSAYPYTQRAFDDHGHGTHVCGTIAQATNTTTAVGCAGIAYKATILPVKVLNKYGSGTNAMVANGIYWATDHDAKIINMSLGSSYGDLTLYNAIKYAYSRGVVIVCASGNNNGAVSYPAAYSTECIAVGATDFYGRRCSFSNFGSSLDIVAPGQYIVQQTLASSSNLSVFSYLSWAGTSMASPHVAGVAALVWSKNPTFTRDQVKAALLSTAKDLGSAGFDIYFGNGLLDANAAVKWAP